MAQSKDAARKRFEAENKIETIDPDLIYKYDQDKHETIREEGSWRTANQPFKKVKISAVALLKMVMHAKSGGRIEVMGVLQGKLIDSETFVVLDAFALPVEASETRVNAQAQGDEYLVNYLSSAEMVGKSENAIGWYHSHPSYGCWLSGIDVGTQKLQQKQGPWVAIVVDPIRTVSSGKVELGAFRTYPESYKPAESSQQWQSIPLDKIEDFGVYANQYYPLEVSYFKSSLDEHLLNLLWNKYWVNTLSSNALLSNRDYFASAIGDVSEKLEQAESQLQHSGRMGMSSQDKKKEENQLSKVTRDATKTAIEQVNSLMNQVIKDQLFNFEKGKPNSGGVLGK
eukprot:TRINITY_DN376_c1_g3_i1.p1 TRINITY_DN376_c1_g3~~TRINITY_DN376_c1_g3_i1.p1  ORF type:complete len:341 (+),score=94.43 TRINITY_DN376_c1_g3_i1:98-1120(+)